MFSPIDVSNWDVLPFPLDFVELCFLKAIEQLCGQSLVEIQTYSLHHFIEWLSFSIVNEGDKLYEQPVSQIA